MNDLIKSNTLKDKDLYFLFFQLLYTLKILENYKIMHNDLHIGNILIERLKQPITLSYKIKDRVYKFDTIHLLKIFDWDMSYCETIGINKKIDSDIFTCFGLNNKFTKGLDLFYVLCILNTFCSDVKFLNNEICLHKIIAILLQDSIIQGNLQLDKKYPNHIDNFEKYSYDGNSCRPYYSIEHLESLDNILFNPLFDYFLSNDSILSLIHI